MAAKYFMKSFIVISLLIFSSLGLSHLYSSEGSVLLDSASLAEKKLYLSLNEALTEPEKTYKLCLGGQEISSLPEEITTLIYLQEINLSQNHLESLPESFCNLTNLQELIIPANGLKKLPENFPELINLMRLDISSNPDLNRESELKKIFLLKNLVFLDLSYNNISSLPVNIPEMKKLKELNLAGNNLPEVEKARLTKLLPFVKIYY
jgi:Leucine-rich repeat (LRR) protein